MWEGTARLFLAKMSELQGASSSDAINKLARAPLIKMCQMPLEMKQEAIEACMSSLEKHPGDYERCAQVSRIFFSNCLRLAASFRARVPTLSNNS